MTLGELELMAFAVIAAFLVTFRFCARYYDKWRWHADKLERW